MKEDGGRRGKRKREERTKEKVDEEETENESRRAKEVQSRGRAKEGRLQKGKEETDRNVPHDESGPPCLTSARSSRPARDVITPASRFPAAPDREIEGDRFIRSLRCCCVSCEEACNNSGSTDGI